MNRELKKILAEALWLVWLTAVLCVLSQAQSLPQATVTGTAYDPQGAVVPNATLRIVKGYVPGKLVSISARTVTANASGVFSFPLPKGAIIWISGNYFGFDKCGQAGCQVKLPDDDPNSTADDNVTLETLGASLLTGYSVSVIPVVSGQSKIAVKNAGTLLSSTISTLNFTGATITESPSGQANITITGGGGGGSLTVEEADGSPAVASVTTLRANQAQGLTVTNPAGGIAQLNLSGVPYSALALTGSILNADINSAANIALAKLATGTLIPTSVVNDTNVTGSLAANTITLGWTGTLADGRIASAATWNAKVGPTRAINTGNGLQGGGDLSADRTIDLRLNASGGLSKTLGGGSNELGIAASGVVDSMLAAGISSSKLTGALPTLDGSALTALNASNLGSGIVPLARLSGITNTEISASAGIALSKLAAINTARLLGRSTAGSGAIEELTIGSGLSLSGGSLALAATIPGNLAFTGTLNFQKATYSTIITLTDAATIATDASLGNRFRVTLGGNRTLGAPINPVADQQSIWEFVQDGAGSRTITLDSGVGGFAFGTDITGITLTTTASKRDFMTAVYNATLNRWLVIGFVRGY
jgi:hypothetical protein